MSASVNAIRSKASATGISRKNALPKAEPSSKDAPVFEQELKKVREKTAKTPEPSRPTPQKAHKKTGETSSDQPAEMTGEATDQQKATAGKDSVQTETENDASAEEADAPQEADAPDAAKVQPSPNSPAESQLLVQAPAAATQPTADVSKQSTAEVNGNEISTYAARIQALPQQDQPAGEPGSAPAAQTQPDSPQAAIEPGARPGDASQQPVNEPGARPQPVRPGEPVLLDSEPVTIRESKDVVARKLDKTAEVIPVPPEALPQDPLPAETKPAEHSDKAVSGLESEVVLTKNDAPRTDSTRAPAQPAPAPQEARFAEVNHPKIVTAMRSELLPHGGSMQIRLDPPEMGALLVSVQMRDGTLTASFQTSNDDATQLLSHSLNQLKAALESQGVSVEKLQVQQAPREHQSGNDDPNQRNAPDQQNSAWQEQQRKQMLQRMWRRIAIGADPLDLVA